MKKRQTIQNKIIDLQAKMLDGAVVPFSIDQEYNVGEMKEEIARLTGVLVESQSLWFEGQEMNDEMVLVEIGMVTGDRIEVKVSKLQVAKGELNQRGIETGNKELLEAARSGDIEVLQWLLQVGGDPNALDQTESSALMHAAQECSLVAMQLLINNGADFNFKGFSGETAASWAAAKGHLEALQVLQEAGCDLSIPDDDGDTPLMWAASNGHLPAVRFLSLHTSHTTTNNNGETALEWARDEGHHDVADFLDSI
eukprot:TRINITY_DN37366_c0_g1_i1.p1 TRINITY_DN37366_c0_g1~~TRINITY_DN37366_c0_g1_i1.p1  ORF type:complete len:271 (+),score=83.61 TRINITY_DN37366_c0_g1_i1:52-813(+)